MILIQKMVHEAPFMVLTDYIVEISEKHKVTAWELEHGIIKKHLPAPRLRGIRCEVRVQPRALPDIFGL